MAFTENGRAACSSAVLASPLLALFDKLVRGLSEDAIRKHVDDILCQGGTRCSHEVVEDLLVMVFQTRWCRGGKGESHLSLVMLKILYEKFQIVVLKLVRLLPHYGCWKDPLSLLLECQETPGHLIDYSELRSCVWDMFAEQLRVDAQELAASKTQERVPKGLSLCAKFAPSEGGEYSTKLNADRHIAERLFAQSGTPVLPSPTVRAKYRRQLTALRSALAVTEVYMCAQRWSHINFSSVPSLCLDRNKSCFLNEKRQNDGTSAPAHPGDPERVSCRDNLLSHITDQTRTKLNATQLFPHEIVKQVLCVRDVSQAVGAVLNAQWHAIRTGVVDSVTARKEHVHAGAAVGLTRMVAMSDVSGSMGGVPMFVSIALGILVSEVSHESFRDKVLTFDDYPQWHNLLPHDSIVDKIKSLASASWGGGTDFRAAMLKIAEVVRRDRLQQCEIPDLIVISDMQFDESGSARGYAYDEIKDIFTALGLELYQRPLQSPKIIFWNVRGDTLGYPCTSTDCGVSLLSGFSPALLKFVLSGEEAVENTDEPPGPAALLATILSDPGLDLVRSAVKASLHSPRSINSE